MVVVPVPMVNEVGLPVTLKFTAEFTLRVSAPVVVKEKVVAEFVLSDNTL